MKQVGDGKGRRGEDPERSFQWYTPKKRRATLYEDVTVDSQPSVHRHSIAGGRSTSRTAAGMWWDDSTALRVGRLVRVPRPRPDVGAAATTRPAPPTSS